jgi:ketosteroid isomerase-like protein
MPGAVETVREGFEAIWSLDVERMLALAHEEVVVPVPQGTERFRDRVEFQGHDGISAWFRDIAARWLFFRLTPLELRELRPDRVAVEGTFVGNPAEGDGYGTFAGWLWTLRDGRVTRIDTYFSRESYEAALAAEAP